MKAIRLDSPGGADELHLVDVPMPEITDDQVLVKIYATSVNQIDWKKAKPDAPASFAPKYPWIPGMDFAGEIVKAGANVRNFAEGEAVFGCSDGGAYAEYIAAETSQIVYKPLEIPFVDAAAAAYVSQTAWQAVHTHGQLQADQMVLIHGAAGAVGAYAVQFAHQAGAVVYASASGRDKDYVKSLGADVFIDYKTEDFTQIGCTMDLVVDTVGGETLDKSYAVIKPEGRLITIAGKPDEQKAEEFGVEAKSIGVKPSADDLAEIADMMDSGDLKCDIAATFWLRDACKGWNYVLNKNSSEKMHGKVVLQVQ